MNKGKGVVHSKKGKRTIVRIRGQRTRTTEEDYSLYKQMFRVWSIAEQRQIRQKGSMKGVKQTHGQTINCREQLNSPLIVSDGWFFVRRGDQESIDNQVSPMTRQQHGRDRQTGRRFAFDSFSPKGKIEMACRYWQHVFPLCFKTIPIRQTYCSPSHESLNTHPDTRRVIRECFSTTILHQSPPFTSRLFFLGRQKAKNMTSFLFSPLPSNGELVSIYPQNLEKSGWAQKMWRKKSVWHRKVQVFKNLYFVSAEQLVLIFASQEISSRHVFYREPLNDPTLFLRH